MSEVDHLDYLQNQPTTADLTGVIIYGEKPPYNSAVVGGNAVQIPAETLIQPLDAQLSAIAALLPAANQAIYFTAADAAALFDTSAYGRALVAAANAAAARTALELGSAALAAAADFATAAQGALADNAVQPADLATVATTGDYGDLLNLPTLGDLAAEDWPASDGSEYVAKNGAWVIPTGFATAAQGALADSAVQPGDLATVATTGAYSDLSGLPTLGTLAALNSPLPIANGGSGQTAQQAAIDALTAVAAATDEHVLTKDTASGNAIWKAASGGAALTIQEVDGTPTVANVDTIVVSNGTLTDDGAGQVTIAIGSGSALPVADTTAIVEGSADDTKLLRFEVDGFTTGTTRVLTPPDADITLAGQNFANTFTAAQAMQGATASITPLTITSTDGDATNPVFLIRDDFNTRDILRVKQDMAGDTLEFGGNRQLATLVLSPSNKQWLIGPVSSNNAFSIRDSTGGGLGFSAGIMYAPPAGTSNTEIQWKNDAGAYSATDNLRISIRGTTDRFEVFERNASTRVFNVRGSGATEIVVPSTTAAVPVLLLSQADVDQPLIEFVTTIGTGNAIEAVGAKTLTTTHFIMVKLPGGLVRYIPVGTIA